MALNSISSEQWVDGIGQIWERSITINDDEVRVCVFHVPKTLSTMKPEAYVPQHIGLGPAHHFQPKLYAMEGYKLAKVKTFLEPYKVFQLQKFIDELLKTNFVLTIRACYHNHLPFSDNTLACVMAIDGLFLLDFCATYNKIDFSGRKLTKEAYILRDIMMLENQLPMILLQEIWRILQIFSSSDHQVDAVRDFGPPLFYKKISPLKFIVPSLFIPTDKPAVNLLDLMYQMILNYRGEGSTAGSVSKDRSSANVFPNPIIQNLCRGNFFDLLWFRNVNKKAGEVEIKLLDEDHEVAEDSDFGLNTISEDNKVDINKEDSKTTSTTAEEIKIPSVSQLINNAGLKFSCLKDKGGIRDIKFDEKEVTLYLPLITLDVNSEVILRNLVAYEASSSMSGITLELAQYVDLMCGIIDTAEDARLLREKKIIKGHLRDAEVADIFNGIPKSMGKPDEKSNHIEDRRESEQLLQQYMEGQAF
ncbi:putative UPF0481 protein At3g02645 isoform X2 [Cornus florida]|uniref:putative UPF0481 protein At3g02645 isoform X2 n=1 Tax=Cornus florida TaxID=4283 RepID=UPI002898BA17|nr:putative UPF0481 protein At3g02645 isoform X2 [Cornus florida]